MIVTVTSNCFDYNHVGNEWGELFSVNGYQISSGAIVDVSINKTVKVFTQIVEYDSIPDIGQGSYSFTIKKDYFENGFYITQTIYVKENRGRYSGNIATWTVKYDFKPLS